MKQQKHQHFPTKDKPWFVFSPEGDMFTFFSTEEEAKEYANDEIHDYCDGEWSEEVKQVKIGKITGVATEFNTHYPPEDFDFENDEMVEAEAEKGYDWGLYDKWCDYLIEGLK